MTAQSALAVAPWGVSGIRALRGYETGEMVTPEPNTNLMAPRTYLPTLRAQIAPGVTTLACAVMGTATGGEECWNNMPQEVESDGQLD